MPAAYAEGLTAGLAADSLFRLRSISAPINSGACCHPQGWHWVIRLKWAKIEVRPIATKSAQALQNQDESLMVTDGSVIYFRYDNIRLFRAHLSDKSDVDDAGVAGPQ